MKIQESIAFKLWAGMMLLVIVVLVLLWFFQIVFLEKFYTGQRLNEVKNRGISIVQNLDLLEREELENKLDSFVYDYNCNVELVDLKGLLIYSSGAARQMPMMMHNQLKAGLLDQILSGNTVTTAFSHPRFGSNYMLVGLPAKAGGEISGALLISIPLAPVKDTAGILKNQLVYICIILFFTALLLSFLLSRTFIKPILDINKAAEEMASGNLSVRLETKSKDEIGRLSHTINYLGGKLSEIEQLRRDFIANVSHELRTPLSLIRGYAETIKDVTGKNEEKREKQLEIIIEESERLSKIVDDILQLSQMQSGNAALVASSFDLHQTLLGIIDKYELLCEQLEIKIDYKGSANIPVKADEAKIKQVLYNLINNAFNHTGTGNLITIRTVASGNRVRVEISDTGEGIPAEEIEHIWERYYKTGNSSGKKRVGTGLGLAIVKSILESHESNYGVESVEGKGTTFWFDLDRR